MGLKASVTKPHSNLTAVHPGAIVASDSVLLVGGTMENREFASFGYMTGDAEAIKRAQASPGSAGIDISCNNNNNNG